MNAFWCAGKCVDQIRRVIHGASERLNEHTEERRKPECNPPSLEIFRGIAVCFEDARNESGCSLHESFECHDIYWSAYT
jgi:hypothetical protein